MANRRFSLLNREQIAQSLTVQDSTKADSVVFSHDGTNLDVTAITTSNFNLDGFGGDLQLLDNMDLSIYSTANANGTTLAQTGIDFDIHGVVATDINVDGFTGNMNLMTGMGLKFWDAGDTDSLRMVAGATNFTMAFNQQTHCNVTGLGGAFWIRDGASLRVSDAADGDYMEAFHTGTTFNFKFTQTTTVVFENLTQDFFVLDFTNDRVISYAPLFMQEQAASNGDTAAFGQFWVKSNAPNTPWFTDDAGSDRPLKMLLTQTTANLANVAHGVNTHPRKVAGFEVFNTDTGLPLWAAGATDGAVWVDATGATAHTPV